jgi:hypothetical protein
MAEESRFDSTQRHSVQTGPDADPASYRMGSGKLFARLKEVGA